jgi:hypothetical protein
MAVSILWQLASYGSTPCSLSTISIGHDNPLMKSIDANVPESGFNSVRIFTGNVLDFLMPWVDIKYDSHCHDCFSPNCWRLSQTSLQGSWRFASVFVAGAYFFLRDFFLLDFPPELAAGLP